MKIGLSKSEAKFHHYTQWLDKYKINFEILDFKFHENDPEKLEECDGLILSGGVDIYPENYCDSYIDETKGTYNPERDSFELQLLERAIKKQIPILAICRGLQLVNVFFRGNLIFDIEEIRNVNHERISPTEDRIHKIKIFENTLLHDITGLEETNVTSSHHQSIDRLGEGLMVNAKSPDGIIEGIEYNEKSGKPFFIGVQWHPERFLNLEDPASKNILDRFISESVN
ncbi:MAG: gamma-glutamyl-gamma-aminobutyrate hydrolase family protein [Ignavibacteria bacterium]